jgi:hypothetical protein
MKARAAVLLDLTGWQAALLCLASRVWGTVLSMSTANSQRLSSQRKEAWQAGGHNICTTMQMCKTSAIATNIVWSTPAAAGSSKRVICQSSCASGGRADGEGKCAAVRVGQAWLHHCDAAKP